MHELSLAQGLLDTIVSTMRQHGATKLISATMEVGELTSVEPEAMRFAYELASKGTPAAGSQLHIVRTALKVRCGACRYEGTASQEQPGCPQCQAPSVEVIAGRELRLVSLDVDE